MSQRANFYLESATSIHNRTSEREVPFDGADGRMIFKVIEQKDLERNMQSQLCVVLGEEYIDLPNDMSLCFYLKGENQVFYIDKWKIYTMPKNVKNKGGKSVKILVSLKEFKALKGMPWVNDDLSNITWQAIQQDLEREPMPHNLDILLPPFDHAVEEARKGGR